MTTQYNYYKDVQPVLINAVFIRINLTLGLFARG